MFGFALCCAGLIVPPILEVGICWHWDSACDNLHGWIGSSDTNLPLTMMSRTDLNHRARWHWRLLSGRCACHLRIKDILLGHLKWPFDFDPLIWAHLTLKWSLNITEQPQNDPRSSLGTANWSAGVIDGAMMSSTGWNGRATLALKTVQQKMCVSSENQLNACIY